MLEREGLVQPWKGRFGVLGRYRGAPARQCAQKWLVCDMVMVC